MYSITVDDCIQITTIIIVYLISITFQSVIFPSRYFSIRDIISDRDTKKLLFSFALKAACIIAIALFFSKVTAFSNANIQLGVSIGSFLCIWPAIYIYDLLFFIKNASKTFYFIGCIMTWLFSVVFVRFTCHTIIPGLFEKQAFILVDNTGLAIIMPILTVVFPIGNIFLFRKLDDNPYFNAETFQYDLYITYRKMDLSESRIIDYSNEIDRASRTYNIPNQILYTVLLLEHINRGSWYVRLFENSLCRFFPYLAIKLDLSIGLAQIKISTAKKLTSSNSKSVMKALFDPCTSIELCASYIRSVYNDLNTDKSNFSLYDETGFCNDSPKDRACFFLASEYLCGTKLALKKYVFVYATILMNCIKSTTFYDDDTNG